MNCLTELDLDKSGTNYEYLDSMLEAQKQTFVYAIIIPITIQVKHSNFQEVDLGSDDLDSVPETINLSSFSTEIKVLKLLPLTKHTANTLIGNKSGVKVIIKVFQFNANSNFF